MFGSSLLMEMMVYQCVSAVTASTGLEGRVGLSADIKVVHEGEDGSGSLPVSVSSSAESILFLFPISKALSVI